MSRVRGGVMVAAGLAALVWAAPPASAGAPTDQLRTQIDRVIRILEDPALKQDGRTVERRRAVRQVANEIFDFTETARRSLARHWASRTPAERREFVELFADLLERAYISKIELYGGERIAYVGELVESDLAVVRTRLTTKQGTEIPIDYRMRRRDGKWWVYDVVIEGVSLVANYRTQFNKIIQTSSYQELVRKMRIKQEEFLEEDRQRRTS